MTTFRNLVGARLAHALQGNFMTLEREEGQTLAEYALILALIAVVVVVVVTTLGGTIKGDLQQRELVDLGVAIHCEKNGRRLLRSDRFGPALSVF